MTARVIDPPWRHWPDVVRVTDVLKAASIPYVFYGGAVRDLLTGNTPSDLDIIVLSTLPQMMNIFTRSELAPIELDDRTIRIFVPVIQIDMTIVTLADFPGAKTFEDAVRGKVATSDFSICAFYLFPPDRFYDDYEGEDDLKAGRVQFLHNPYTQTRDNPKYILRYFRFWARFGKEPMDEVILSACTTNAPLLPNIPRLRAYAEMRKLFSIDDPRTILATMRDRNILPYAVGIPLTDFSLLEPLRAVETMAGEASPWYARLFALLLNAPLAPERCLEHLFTFWQLKPEYQLYLTDLLNFFPATDPAMPAAEKQALIDKYGANFVRALLFLRWMLEDDVESAKAPYLAALATLEK